MKSLGILLFLVVFLVVLIGLPVLIAVKIYKGFKRSGFAMRDVVLNGKRATATVVNASIDVSGQGRRPIVVYEFEAYGKTFQGSTADRNLDRGDTLEVEFDAENPEVSFPAVLVEEARRKAPKALLANGRRHD